MGDSAVATRSYSIQCAAPTYSVLGSTPQLVTISTITSGATIRYTTDGSIPSETNGIIYTVPVIISTTVTLQALAYFPVMADSPVTAQSLHGRPVRDPDIQPGVEFLLHSANGDHQHDYQWGDHPYTMDGSTPTETHGMVYTGPLTLSTNVTLQAIAWEPDMGDSASGHAELYLSVCHPDIQPGAG